MLVRLLHWPRDPSIAENANLAQGLSSPLAWGRLNHHGSWGVSLRASLRMDKTWRRAHRRVRLSLRGQRILMQQWRASRRHEHADRIIS